MTLHLITDRRRLAGGNWGDQQRCLREQVRYAVEAGVDVVQLRERDLEAAALYAIALSFVAAAAGSRTRIVVNDRLDVALAAGAHGVHLRGDSIPPAVVRRLAPRGFLVGRSVHDPAEAATLAGQVDYLLAGTVWPTPSKPPDHRLLGLRGLSATVQAARVPVLAIGGVTLDRFAEVAATGAAGVAAIGLFINRTTSADKPGECGAMPLHDLAQGAAARVTATSPATR